MLNDICKYCKLKTCSGQINVDGHCPSMLKMFLKYLESGIYTNEYKVMNLLGQLSVAHDDINFLTTKYFNSTPKKLIENLKLEKVLVLMENNYTINKIMNECGYSQLRTFQKAFKRRFKQSFLYYKNLISKSKEKDVIIRKLIEGLWE